MEKIKQDVPSELRGFAGLFEKTGTFDRLKKKTLCGKLLGRWFL
jgi:hypothetical protein